MEVIEPKTETASKPVNEPTNVMEPIIQIKTEPNTVEEIPNPMEPEIQIMQDVIEPEIQIMEQPVNLPETVTQVPPQQTEPVENLADKTIKQEHLNFFENIGLFENSSTVAKIGECTISVSNVNGNTSLTPNTSMELD